MEKEKTSKAIFDPVEIREMPDGLYEGGSGDVYRKVGNKWTDALTAMHVGIVGILAHGGIAGPLRLVPKGYGVVCTECFGDGVVDVQSPRGCCWYDREKCPQCEGVGIRRGATSEAPGRVEDHQGDARDGEPASVADRPRRRGADLGPGGRPTPLRRR